MNKRGVIPIIVIALLVVGALVVFGSGFLDTASIGSYENVYKQNWGHLCCLAGPLETLAGPRYADDVTSTSCSENVDQCQLIINPLGPFPALTIGTVDVEWNECNLDGTNCVKRTYKLGKNDKQTYTLEAGKKVTFLKGGIAYDYRKFYTWERKGAVYDLVGQENGKIFVSDGCSLSNSLKGDVLSGVPNQIPRGYDYCVNYITDWVSVATKTYTYNGQKVICQARTLYEVDQQTFKSGELINLQGEKIKSVDCCPAESNCGEDFKFHTTVDRECTYSSECDNGGDLYPLTQTTAGYFVCESGACVKKTKSVECTSDAVCQTRHGEGYICSFAESTWGTCIKAPTGPYCGDGYCDIGESKSTCIADCELECLPGEKIVTKEKRVDCTIGFPLYIGCDTEVTKECKVSATNWVLIIILIVASVVAYMFVLRPILKSTKFGRWLP
jgi:hypothetical protein